MPVLNADNGPNMPRRPLRYAAPGLGKGPSSLATWSWVLYDLANTIFSMNIVSFFFSLWVVNVMSGSDSHYALANGLSMAAIFFASPYLGALTDQAPRRMPFLIFATVSCVLFTALLGRAGLGWSLVLFALANISYQAGLQFYDALLPEVSTPANRGRVGGSGVAVGYLGSLIGLGLGRLILGESSRVSAEEAAKSYVLLFQATAAVFLVFALPCFFFVRERLKAGVRFGLSSFAAAGRQTVSTILSLRRLPQLARFLAGRALYADAINTIIAFMGIYTTAELGMSGRSAINVMVIGVVFAALGAAIFGMLVDKFGPAPTLRWVLQIWLATLAWIAAVGLLNLPLWTFWIVPPLTGIALGGTWAADRPFMLLLTPKEKIGEYYGLYGMVGRFASVSGPLLWALVAEGLGWGRPAAVLSLMLFVSLSYLILRPIMKTGSAPLGR